MPADAWYKNRVTENLRREILWAISNDLRDPDLPDTMITVPSIELAQDTRNATVYISVFGDDEVKEQTIMVLNRAASAIQRAAARKVKIKNFPRLYFKIDNTFDERDRISSLLDKVKDDLE